MFLSHIIKKNKKQTYNNLIHYSDSFSLNIQVLIKNNHVVRRFTSSSNEENPPTGVL